MYGKSDDAETYQSVPRPVTALAVDFPDRHRVGHHSHPRHQLIYASAGVVVVNTDAGAWVVPPLRAIWMPAGQAHWLRMVGNCEMRTLYIDPAAKIEHTDNCAVVEVSPLLRELILAAVRIPMEYELESRDSLVMELLLREIQIEPLLGLHLPMPTHPELAGVCKKLIQNPELDQTLEQWSDEAGLGSKTLARLFLRHTGMTFGRWRQQARLLASLPLLARGDSVLNTAISLGYDSPSAFTAMFRGAMGMTPSRYFVARQKEEAPHA